MMVRSLRYTGPRSRSALLLCAALLGHPDAWAEKTQAARGARAQRDRQRFLHYMKEGKKAFQDKQYQAALTYYASAYQIHQEPICLFNEGQCHWELKQYQEALDKFERFIAEAPPAHPQRGDAVRYVAELRLRLYPPPPWYRRPWPWVGLGSALALGAAAIALGVALPRRDPDTTLGVFVVFP